MCTPPTIYNPQSPCSSSRAHSFPLQQYASITPCHCLFLRRHHVACVRALHRQRLNLQRIIVDARRVYADLEHPFQMAKSSMQSVSTRSPCVCWCFCSCTNVVLRRGTATIVRERSRFLRAFARFAMVFEIVVGTNVQNGLELMNGLQRCYTLRVSARTEAVETCVNRYVLYSYCQINRFKWCMGLIYNYGM